MPFFPKEPYRKLTIKISDYTRGIFVEVSFWCLKEAVLSPLLYPAFGLRYQLSLSSYLFLTIFFCELFPSTLFKKRAFSLISIFIGICISFKNCIVIFMCTHERHEWHSWTAVRACNCNLEGEVVALLFTCMARFAI